MDTDETRIYFRTSFSRRKMFSWRMVPCVIFEDEHLLAVNKPAGWNTHAPSPFAGEGIYDWLRNREPRWASLAIIHRLDKETSGVIVFGKTPLANKSLTEQFATRQVHKKYLLLTDRQIPQREFVVKSKLIRIGEKYASRANGEMAETKFALVTNSEFQIKNSELKMVSAEPLTGRTHQIRVHASENGFPILGDTLYGGTNSSRVFLHAAEIQFTHPATGELVKFVAPTNFDDDARQILRSAVIEPNLTNAFRLIHGASDGWPNWFVDKFDKFLLSQSESPLNAQQNDELARLAKIVNARGTYHKTLSRQIRRSTPNDSSPQLVFGEDAPDKFEILENGIRYEMSFREGYSVGLFLDQRDNRRRFLTGHVAVDFPFFKSKIGNWKLEILNCFAYTCGFSVCATKSGARTTSLDLSKKYLEWGKRNFALNGIDSAQHDFIYGDTFDWLRRLAKKGRTFDTIVLDPPTFSQSKESGVFRVEKDFGKLVAAALPVLKPDGILFCSTNAADFPPEKFLAQIEAAVFQSRRKFLQQHYFPQPPDFSISRAEPAYLKTVWIRVS
ncbi:MAG TPA: pseudouridine synthase [Verrucomicrobiae bacterium]|nr:pseudouridine synthase [Verrucomicrobiae bacterium]